MSEVSIQKAMQAFLKKSKLKNGIQSVQIEEIWNDLMGVTVSKYTDKIKIIGQTLFITTKIAPLKNELLYQRETIIEKVNAALGEKIIKQVVIN